jgi:haloacetate dehalogenase
MNRIVLEDLPHHKAVLGDITLHYVEAGSKTGETVVLLHGWPQSSFAWRHVQPELANRYRVIAPDLRGFGDSSKPMTGYDTARSATKRAQPALETA